MSKKVLKIYNTMSRKIEEFHPLIEEGKKDFVWIYSCWPTVYSEPHIGNMRAYVFADILRNVIKNILWYPVKHVVNITDVWHLTDDADQGEDKIEKAAKKEKLSAWDIARKYENIFKNYLQMLNIEPFDVMPRATEHIKEQIDMVKKLEEKWYTYKTSDWIYMDTSKVSDYWKLARLDKEGLKAGARVDLWEKKNPTDFALWKFSPKDKKRQMEWDSPWWVWFPGWHIECSAMSTKYLWEQFDIHTWWVDHIPVHHTNEIAQSECALGIKPWVKYWMHVQYLLFKWEKASKSKGNVVTLRQLIEKWFDPMDLRYMFLTSHYRSFIDFTWENLEKARKGRLKLIRKILEILKNIWGKSEEILKKIEEANYDYELKEKLEEIVLNDLNTPKVIAEIHKVLSDISDKIKNSSDFFRTSKDVLSILKTIDWFDKAVLKLNLLESAIEQLKKQQDIPEEIKQLAEKRWKAKLEKNYQLADKLREEIRSKWYEILDKKDGYEIVKI